LIDHHHQRYDTCVGQRKLGVKLLDENITQSLTTSFCLPTTLWSRWSRYGNSSVMFVCLCVCQSVSTIPLERSGLWSRYLACWYIL